jgi:hypothetical protein
MRALRIPSVRISRLRRAAPGALCRFERELLAPLAFSSAVSLGRKGSFPSARLCAGARSLEKAFTLSSTTRLQPAP